MGSLISALRASTRSQHEQLESVTRLPQSLSDLSDLKSVLSTFLGYYVVLDRQLQHPSTCELPDDVVLRPWRSKVLAEDLALLGADLPPLLGSPQLPQATTAYQQWGIRYVIEGSALGGKTIRAYLRRHPSLAPWSDKISFFNIYGADTARQWANFLSELDRLDPMPAEQAQAVEAAQIVFATLTDWFRLHRSRPLEGAENSMESMTEGAIER